MTEEKRRRPITASYGAVFQRINRRKSISSLPVHEARERVFDAVVAAAIAKCIEYNVAVNRSRKYKDEEYLFMGALRGICEDLISLCYIKRMRKAERENIIRLQLEMAIENGLDVQSAFFAANNPYQPILSRKWAEGSMESPSGPARRQAVREFWASLGIDRRSGPTVKEMASDVGLTHIYDYVYFASSNFVHFNPQSLLRMGWGDKEGKFVFSTSNVSQYYKLFSSFYGAILFVAYHSAFSESHFRESCEQEISLIFELIEQNQRWPEVVTFEEMNQKPPSYFLSYILRSAASDGGAVSGMLSEVRGLRERVNSDR